MGVKTNFEVTEKAGDFVAGVRKPLNGKAISLTEEQAYYPLVLGEIKRPSAVTATETDPTAGKSKKA